MGGFKNLPDRRSRRREEAELDLLQKSASSRRRLRFLNPPCLWPELHFGVPAAKKRLCKKCSSTSKKIRPVLSRSCATTFASRASRPNRNTRRISQPAQNGSASIANGLD